MLEELILNMSLGQKIAAYAFLLAGLFIFVKTGKLRIMGRPVIPMKWRITLALFFPIIFGLGIVFGAAALGILIALIAFTALIGIFSGKKPKIPKFPGLKIKVIRKKL
jgi:hypothetical protein